LFNKLVLVDYQPTCENILIDIASRIKKELPIEIQLHHLKLRETPSSYAEWHADDNF
jgi:6-pyruvoyltetrahydropterin/6-carboxytetrahydropterin synthase